MQKKNQRIKCRTHCAYKTIIVILNVLVEYWILRNLHAFFCHWEYASTNTLNASALHKTDLDVVCILACIKSSVRRIQMCVHYSTFDELNDAPGKDVRVYGSRLAIRNSLLNSRSFAFMLAAVWWTNWPVVGCGIYKKEQGIEYNSHMQQKESSLT